MLPASNVVMQLYHNNVINCTVARLPPAY